MSWSKCVLGLLMVIALAIVVVAIRPDAAPAITEVLRSLTEPLSALAPWANQAH